MIEPGVVNLYPFEETGGAPERHLEEAIENIDIGGPRCCALAAKNHRYVTVNLQPAALSWGAGRNAQPGARSGPTRRSLARGPSPSPPSTTRPSTTTSAPSDHRGRGLPRPVSPSLQKTTDLRYGENHISRAPSTGDDALSRRPAASRQLHGKALSYNNYLDLNAVLGFVRELQARPS